MLAVSFSVNLFLFTVPSASAATITVNTTADEQNTDGDCSLREAVASSEADANVDGCIATGTYGDDTIDLTGINGGIVITAGEMAITQSLTLVGPGYTNLRIGQYDPFFDPTRFLTFQPIDNTKTLTISGIELNGFGDWNYAMTQGGTLKSTGGTLELNNVKIVNSNNGDFGGGIYSSGNLEVNNSIFENNFSSTGSAIYIDSGSATITNTQFPTNTSFHGVLGVNTGTVVVTNSSFDASYGGAIFNSAGTLTLESTDVINHYINFDDYSAGAIINLVGGTININNSNVNDNNIIENLYGSGLYNLGTATITSSTFDNNSIGVGGGGGSIYNAGTLLVQNSIVSDSVGAPYGGGIVSVSGNLTINNSTIDGNNTPSPSRGSGIGVTGGTATITSSNISNNLRGGLYVNSGIVTVTNTTFSGNSNTGGIEVEGGTLITNGNTFTGNTNTEAGNGGGGILVNSGTANVSVINSTLTANSGNNGGGILLKNGTVDIINSTFYGNTSSGDASNAGNLGVIGGTATITNSLIVKNGNGQNCNGTFTDGGHNLQYGDSTCTGIPTAVENPLDITGLANNGGPTFTIALTENSEALDAGDNTVCTDPGTVNSVDQRGEVRPSGSACDIGAFEYQTLGGGDTTPPTITNITSSKANGTYSTGEIIAIQISFDEVVTVTGTPQLTLETGDSDAIVAYTSGSGTDTLTFSYTVEAGHTSSDLDYTATTSLALNGGTIRDAANNNAELTFPAPGGTGSLGNNKDIVIDTTPPTVTSVTQVIPNRTSDTTPSVTFSSNEGGAIAYGGSCSSGTTIATVGNNTITFNELALGTYTDCTMRVIDTAGNESLPLHLESFTIEESEDEENESSGGGGGGGGGGSSRGVRRPVQNTEIPTNQNPISSNTRPDGTEDSGKPDETNFDDIKGHKYEKEILELAKQCNLQGYPDQLFRTLTYFKPDQTITRGELITMLIKCKYPDLVLDQKTTPYFFDLSIKDPMTPYIEKGWEDKIVQGYPDGSFRPYNPTLHSEALKMIALTWINIEAINMEQENKECSDVKPTNWFAKYYHWALNNLILSDNDLSEITENKIKVKNCRAVKEITRGEAAYIILKTKFYSTKS